MKYDPDKNINPGIWLSLEDAERTYAVQRFHADASVRLPNPTVHAMFHVIAENQIALGDQFIARPTLERLMEEGLGRHEAVHAIMSVVAGHVFKTLNEKDPLGDGAAAYQQKLSQLTAADWLKQTS